MSRIRARISKLEHLAGDAGQPVQRDELYASGIAFTDASPNTLAAEMLPALRGQTPADHPTPREQRLLADPDVCAKVMAWRRERPDRYADLIQSRNVTPAETVAEFRRVTRA